MFEFFLRLTENMRCKILKFEALEMEGKMSLKPETNNTGINFRKKMSFL